MYGIVSAKCAVFTSIRLTCQSISVPCYVFLISASFVLLDAFNLSCLVGLSFFERKSLIFQIQYGRKFKKKVRSL